MSTSEVEAIITSMLNVKEPATVYGVEIPNTEGKAGMLAIPMGNTLTSKSYTRHAWNIYQSLQGHFLFGSQRKPN